MDKNYLWIGDPASLFYVLFIRFWFLGFDLWDCVVCVCVFFFFVFVMRFRCLIYCLWDFFVRMVVLLHTHFFVFRSCSCFCYILVMKTLWALHLWCKEKGFPLFLFMDLVLLYFRSQCVCVCFFLISRLVFLDLGLYFCSRHTYISIYVIFNF